MIEKQEGPEFPAAKLKLIYSGKILQDAQPLCEYKLGESGFVVVMVSKSKPAAQAAPPPAPSQPSVDPTPSEPSEAAPHGTEHTDSVVTRATPPAADSTPASEVEPSSVPEHSGTGDEQSMEGVQEGSTGDASLAAAQSNLGRCFRWCGVGLQRGRHVVCVCALPDSRWCVHVLVTGCFPGPVLFHSDGPTVH